MTSAVAVRDPAADRDQVVEMVQQMLSTYGPEPPAERIAMYTKALAGYTAGEVEEAILHAMREAEDYPPGPGRVCKHARLIRGDTAAAQWRPPEQQAFLEITLPAELPEVQAFRECDPKGDLDPDWKPPGGMRSRFLAAHDPRCGAYEDAYRKAGSSMGDAAPLAWWAALNDLCQDGGELGVYARRVRAKRCRAVVDNAVIARREPPRYGRS